jgi:adenine-specific DNA-methyltransferase
MLPRPAAGKCVALCGDSETVASSIEADVAYLDPPYNQHSYLGNYHVWESLIRWDKPEVYGIACKRMDCRERKSAFNSRPGIKGALERTVNALRCPILVISFNNEGYLERPEVEQVLRKRGHLEVIELTHDRYVGARIGIYNLKGEKVGNVGHLQNKEYLYVVSNTPLAIAEKPVSSSSQLELL